MFKYYDLLIKKLKFLIIISIYNNIKKNTMEVTRYQPKFGRYDAIDTIHVNSTKTTRIYQCWIMTKILSDEYIRKFISDYLLTNNYYKLKCSSISCNDYDYRYDYHNHTIYFKGNYNKFLYKLNDLYKNMLFNYLYDQRYSFYPNKFKHLKLNHETYERYEDFINIPTNNGKFFGPITPREYYVKLTNVILSENKLRNMLLCRTRNDINVIKIYKDLKEDYFLTKNKHDYFHYPIILCKPYIKAKFFKLENDKKSHGVIFQTGIEIVKIIIDRQHISKYEDKKYIDELKMNSNLDIESYSDLDSDSESDSD